MVAKTIWDRLKDYEKSIEGKILTEEDVEEDLLELFPPTPIRGEAWERFIIENAKRLANYHPEFVESLDEFDLLD